MTSTSLGKQNRCLKKVPTTEESPISGIGAKKNQFQCSLWNQNLMRNLQKFISYSHYLISKSKLKHEGFRSSSSSIIGAITMDITNHTDCFLKSTLNERSNVANIIIGTNTPTQEGRKTTLSLKRGVTVLAPLKKRKNICVFHCSIIPPISIDMFHGFFLGHPQNPGFATPSSCWKARKFLKPHGQ